MEKSGCRASAGEGSSVHVMPFREDSDEWHDPDLAAKWEKIRDVRSVITGALENRTPGEETIGSALEAATPEVYVSNPDYLAALAGVDLAEISITSVTRLIEGEGLPMPSASTMSKASLLSSSRRRAENAPLLKISPKSAAIRSFLISPRAMPKPCVNGTTNSGVAREARPFSWGHLSVLAFPSPRSALRSTNASNGGCFTFSTSPPGSRLDTSCFRRRARLETRHFLWLAHPAMPGRRNGCSIGRKYCRFAILWVWSTRTDRPLTATALGLVIGGAWRTIGQGALWCRGRFLSFSRRRLQLYIFNLADVAIVAVRACCSMSLSPRQAAAEARNARLLCHL